MQVVPSGGQICNLCKWLHLVAKFAINASSAIWWPNLQLMQVVPSGGRICNYCKWCHVVAKFNPSYGVDFWVRCASGNVFANIWIFLIRKKWCFWVLSFSQIFQGQKSRIQKYFSFLDAWSLTTSFDESISILFPQTIEYKHYPCEIFFPFQPKSFTFLSWC